MRNLPKSLLGYKATEAPIVLYQKIFSPDHGMFASAFGNTRCRFFPSCSEYTLRALSQYGLFKGAVLSVKRILRCGPWSAGGYDPVKSANSESNTNLRINESRIRYSIIRLFAKKFVIR